MLYPGSYVDIAPSFVFPSVTYVDSDKRCRRFFDDVDGVREIIAGHSGSPTSPEFDFILADYTGDLGLDPGSFDLLVSLYGGFVSDSCTRYLRVGGTLLVNPSHGDAALVAIDERYELRGVITARAGTYLIHTDGLDAYLRPKSGKVPLKEQVLTDGRAVAYTKPAFAYLFERTS